MTGISKTRDWLGLRDLPSRTRLNFVVEARHILFWGLFAGMIEGGVSAVIASKTFHAGIWLIALVQATPAVANVTSLIWGVVLVGRPKLPILLALGAACAAVTISISLTPITPSGAWIFAAQIALSRVFMAGVVEARASLWKINYPRSHRGRIAANLQIIRTLGSIPLILLVSALFDARPEAFRWVYPAIAAVGAVALLMIRGLRVRDPRFARNATGREEVACEGDGVIEPLPLTSIVQPWRLVGRMRGALRRNPRFARYCEAQMCIGSANLMLMPVHTVILTRVLRLSYTHSNELLEIIPRAVTLLMLPFWARLFDRVGVLRFRVANSLCWAGSAALAGVGALLATLDPANRPLFFLAIGLYAAGRLVDGLAQSGGSIAWNIGHLHFAEDDQAELLMGIHVSLTGLRGLFMPFFGTLVYARFGCGVFLASTALALFGCWLFWKLAREERRDSEQAQMAKDRVGAGNDVAQLPDLVRR